MHCTKPPLPTPAALSHLLVLMGAGGKSSIEDKFLVWLVFEHALLLLKVLVHVTIPDQPASLAITKARQRWVEHRLIGVDTLVVPHASHQTFV